MLVQCLPMGFTFIVKLDPRVLDFVGYEVSADESLSLPLGLLKPRFVHIILLHLALDSLSAVVGVGNPSGTPGRKWCMPSTSP